MVTRPLAIRPIGPDRYCEYAAISNDFLVTSILRVDAVDGGLGGMVLVEERIERPYLKDIERLIKKSIRREDDNPFASTVAEAPAAVATPSRARYGGGTRGGVRYASASSNRRGR